VLTLSRRPRFSGRGRRVRFHPPATWHHSPLVGLEEAFRATLSIEKALGENVRRAVASGYTWQDVGRALGVADDAASSEDVIGGLVVAKTHLWRRMFSRDS
jgi:hypothetical protein